MLSGCHAIGTKGSPRCSFPPRRSPRFVPSLRAAAFTVSRTRAKAIPKARGKGLATLLTEGKRLRVDGTHGVTPRWSVETLSLNPGFVASLAVEGWGWHLKTWHWPA